MRDCFKRFKHLPKSLKIIIAMSITLIMFIASVYIVSFLLGPPPLTNEQNTIYYSEDDEVIGGEQGSENRIWVSLDDISPSLIQAILTVEDQHFYKHYGIDLKRMISATITDLKSLSLKEGASTLTQQYARNLYLSHEKSWWRKIKEIFYAIRMEMFYSKREILEGYLNTIYFGHGAYGIETASKYFFRKPARNLTLAEATMLAGIPKGPSYYSPLKNLQNAKRRQKHILQRLRKSNQISDKTFFLASREHLTYAEDENEKSLGSYFQDTVLKEAARILNTDPELIRSGGYSIYTTMNAKQQKQLEEKRDNIIDTDSDIEVSAMAMDPKTGAIKALIGGRDYKKSPFNRAMSAKRMPGSAFKPFLYYAALEHNYTPSTRLLSKPTSFVLENDDVYTPSNYNDYYANEPITLAQALAVSDNIYAVKTNLFLGLDKLPKIAKKFGFKDDLPKAPSLALGSAVVTMNDMVTGFSKIANGGRDIDSHTIRKIVDHRGNIVYEQQEKATDEQLLDPNKTFVLTHLLTGMFDETLNGYTSVTGESIAEQLSQTYAGKSGTTDSDHWMIGYSPSLVTGVWTGYDDNRPVETARETSYAKDIWAHFMEAAHEGKKEQSFKAPSEVVAVRVDPETGELATPYCSSSRLMYYEAGTEPTQHCSMHLPDQDEDQQPEKKRKDKGLLRRLFELFT